MTSLFLAGSAAFGPAGGSPLGVVSTPARDCQIAVRGLAFWPVTVLPSGRSRSSIRAVRCRVGLVVCGFASGSRGFDLIPLVFCFGRLRFRCRLQLRIQANRGFDFGHLAVRCCVVLAGRVFSFGPLAVLLWGRSKLSP